MIIGKRPKNVTSFMSCDGSECVPMYCKSCCGKIKRCRKCSNLLYDAEMSCKCHSCGKAISGCGYVTLSGVIICHRRQCKSDHLFHQIQKFKDKRNKRRYRRNRQKRYMKGGLSIYH